MTKCLLWTETVLSILQCVVSPFTSLPVQWGVQLLHGREQKHREGHWPRAAQHPWRAEDLRFRPRLLLGNSEPWIPAWVVGNCNQPSPTICTGWSSVGRRLDLVPEGLVDQDSNLSIIGGHWRVLSPGRYDPFNVLRRFFLLQCLDRLEEHGWKWY